MFFNIFTNFYNLTKKEIYFLNSLDVKKKNSVFKLTLRQGNFKEKLDKFCLKYFDLKVYKGKKAGFLSNFIAGLLITKVEEDKDSLILNFFFILVTKDIKLKLINRKTISL